MRSGKLKVNMSTEHFAMGFRFTIFGITSCICKTVASLKFHLAAVTQRYIFEYFLKH